MKQIVRRERHENLHASVEYADLVFLSGLAADDDSLPIRGQAKQIVAKIDAALAEAGSHKSRILMATVFLTDFALKPDMNAVWTDWLAPEDLPARMTIARADLGGPLVEIVVIAAKTVGSRA